MVTKSTAVLWAMHCMIHDPWCRLVEVWKCLLMINNCMINNKCCNIHLLMKTVWHNQQLQNGDSIFCTSFCRWGIHFNFKNDLHSWKKSVCVLFKIKMWISKQSHGIVLSNLLCCMEAKNGHACNYFLNVIISRAPVNLFVIDIAACFLLIINELH